MKVITATDQYVHIELTRRNLMTLLAKLDGHPPNSACTILSHDSTPTIAVAAVENEVHYADRHPGVMVEQTEEYLTFGKSETTELLEANFEALGYVQTHDGRWVPGE